MRHHEFLLHYSIKRVTTYRQVGRNNYQDVVRIHCHKFIKNKNCLEKFRYLMLKESLSTRKVKKIARLVTTFKCYYRRMKIVEIKAHSIKQTHRSTLGEWIHLKCLLQRENIFCRQEVKSLVFETFKNRGYS